MQVIVLDCKFLVDNFIGNVAKGTENIIPPSKKILFLDKKITYCFPAKNQL